MLTLRCPLSWKTHLLSSVKNCSLPDFSCLLPQNIYHQFGIPKSDELFVGSKRIRIRYRHKHIYKSRSHFHGFQILVKKKLKKKKILVLQKLATQTRIAITISGKDVSD
jgi:hypothetical protein